MQCCESGMIYSGSGSSNEFQTSGSWSRCGGGFNPYYLSQFERKKLKFNQKEEFSPICHLLFHTTVLQYTQSRIHRSKIRNKGFIYLFFHFLLDPDSDLGKSSGSMRPGSATLCLWFQWPEIRVDHFGWNKLLVRWQLTTWRRKKF